MLIFGILKTKMQPILVWKILLLGSLAMLKSETFSVIFEHGVEKTGGKEEQSLKSCFVVILHSRVLQIANLFLKIIKIVAKLTFLARKFDYFASVASQIHFFQYCKQKFT